MTVRSYSSPASFKQALRLVLLATTAWLQAVLARTDGPPRLQVLAQALRPHGG